MRKFVVAAGITLGILVLIMFIASLRKDELRSRLDTISQTNVTMAELSKEAASQAGNYTLQVTATNIAAVVTSDNQQLAVAYQTRYRKQPPQPKADEIEALTKLKDTPSGSAYDQEYKLLVIEQLEKNLAAIKTVTNQASGQNLKDALSTGYNDQTQLLEQLKR
ncbi:hypothetical protein HY441_02195 [Candidatus Microgenomates bacterium]|nr:hypothetical protein [Candidatus Microgenomates bacterium]